MLYHITLSNIIINYILQLVKLGIKYQSLYNHFVNIDDLKIKITVYLLNNLNLELMQRLIGKSGEIAFREFAYAYRDFALENKTAYGVCMNVPQDDDVKRLADIINIIIHKILNYCIKDESLTIHKSRELRSLLHGFVSLSAHGYFQNPSNLEVSFQIMIDDFITSVLKK